MDVRPLTAGDSAAYLHYRREIWPDNSAAGDWEAVTSKYLENPLVSLCPGSGLYGCFDGSDLLGIWGAFPMPVTLNGAVHPGHLLVDSYVLPRSRNLPVGGILFRAVRNLPGRKYASYGTDYLQGQLARIGVRLESTSSIAIWDFVPALMVRAWKLAGSMQPCPVFPDSGELAPGVRVADAAAIRPETPPSPERQAYVARDALFWQYFCSCRVRNGALPLHVRTANAEADLVIRLEAAGKIRMATLLSLHLQPYSRAAALEIGRVLRRGLSALGVFALAATEPDDGCRALQDGVGIHVRRSPAHWWSIRAKDDAFDAASVEWRLTYADRDSSWGGIQPSRA